MDQQYQMAVITTKMGSPDETNKSQLFENLLAQHTRYILLIQKQVATRGSTPRFHRCFRTFPTGYYLVRLSARIGHLWPPFQEGDLEDRKGRRKGLKTTKVHGFCRFPFPT